MSIDSDRLDRGSLPKREKFTIHLKCSCGQAGTATWEEYMTPNPQGPMPVLLGVSSGFYERVQKKDIGQIEIVCAICEKVIRD